ncbi:hypothetical protein [Thiomicrorhabdus sp. Kp2]|uniref:hypothetical protein n=1 Tax=Thiomicrorhabdus sp. Kp2 TaxID=1123518 RepID=UPI000415AEB4|nr:hypothetical protein [Thiomicrorhabdus sp. Kp2]
MVKFIKVLLFGFLPLFFVSAVFAVDSQVTRPGNLNETELLKDNTPIEVKIRPTHIQLGQPVSLVIEGEKIGKSTALLDWTELKQNFVIDDVDQHSYLLRLILYPLREGELVIAEQKAGRVHIPKTVIKVEPNPEVAIEWQKPKTELFSTQQGLWQAQVTVKNPAFLVEMQSPEGLKNAGLITHLLSSESDPQNHMVSFEMPRVSELESLPLKSPIVEVKNTSNQRWKFFDSAHTVQVKPLPTFLPMSVAVGQLDWHIAPFEAFYQVGDLYYWNWQITGQGLTDKYVKATAYQLISQLTHNEQVSWLAESMQVTSMSNDKGMLTLLDVQVPFRIKQPGLVTFPELVLRGFNPEMAKVSQQTFAAIQVMALPGWLVWSVYWLALVLGIASGYFLLLILKQYGLNLRLRKEINQAKSSEVILQAILHWQSKHLLNSTGNSTGNSTEAEGSQKVHSLNQFEQWFKQHYGESPLLSVLIQDMNEVLYAKANPLEHFADIKKNAQAWSDALSIIKGSKLAFRVALKTLIHHFKKHKRN